MVRRVRRVMRSVKCWETGCMRKAEGAYALEAVHTSPCYAVVCSAPG